jgi:quinol monooxygenase YgiN
MMTFVQTISYYSDRSDEISRAEEEWLAATEGERTVAREQVLVDRADPRHYLVVVEFPSAEAAAHNSALPATDALARRMRDLSDGDPVFTDYDLVRSADETGQR